MLCIFYGGIFVSFVEIMVVFYLMELFNLVEELLCSSMIFDYLWFVFVGIICVEFCIVCVGRCFVVVFVDVYLDKMFVLIGCFIYSC